jgi:hypothetical protein
VTEGGPTGAGRPPTEEELRAAMEEELRRLRVQDVLLQTVVTLVNLGGRRLGLAPEAKEERDLEQARLAIESTRALLPLLGAEEGRAIREALSQLQVAFAREARSAEQQPHEAEAGARAPTGGAAGERSAAPAPGAEGDDRGRQAAAAGEEPTPEELERARARSKIWTPPGS